MGQLSQPNASPIEVMASRLSVKQEEMQSIVMNTLMKAKPGGQQPSHEEFVTFLVIANEYGLNPLSKEIYAFANRGAIQPIVSIDGWLRIINQHPQFDGMEFEDTLDANGNLSAITCRIYRKDRTRQTEVTEYLDECKGTSDPWKKWPARMLRHKAAIQCARYAFGLSGIVDPDEAERIKDVTSQGSDTTVETTQAAASTVEPLLPLYSDDAFQDNLPKWKEMIEEGKSSPEHIITMVGSRARLSPPQIKAIKELAA
ncbi:MAG: RecT family recombinase [Pontibacterium sp.]